MEVRYGKEIGLKRFFLSFLLRVFVSLLLICGIWALSLSLGANMHILAPANAVENAVYRFLGEWNPNERLVRESLPEGADYACFTKEGGLEWTNLSGEALEAAKRLTASEKVTKSSLGTLYFVRMDTDTQVLVLAYRLRAVFLSPVLRRLFPSADMFWLVTLLLAIFGDLAFWIFRYAKKMNRELALLQEASERLRERNLDFDMPRTSLAELNEIMDSLRLLKEGLEKSLKIQWTMEQQKKKQMSALAHDIKTPLTIVKGNAELLAESGLNEEQQLYNRYILENAGQIGTYVTRMLELSRKQESDFAYGTVLELLAEVEKAAESLCREKQLRFAVQAEEAVKAMQIPEEGMKRVLLNLLDNAVQYSPEGSTITLIIQLMMREENGQRELVFVMEDEGTGFSEEALRFAAEEFYRADKSRGSREHFGVGLASVRQIAEELCGELHIENRKSGGAAVTVQIPLPIHSRNS